ncbi:MAG: hypothetical protein ACYC9Y_08525 [Candidatus Methylomirabilia bacterium]
MKAYRGMVLGCVGLLMAVSLSSCGDADDWKQTSEIKLEAKQGTGLNDIVFTVRSTPPDATDSLNACETVLEYRAEGAGVDIRWHSIYGNETTRVFSVKPRRAGEMTVVARGKCAGSREDWKYSNIVNVSVTAAVLPTVTSVTLTATPSTVDLAVAPHDVVISLTASVPAGCTLNLWREHEGGGLPPYPSTSTAQGLFTLTPNTTTSLVVLAKAWCSENPTAIVSATVTVTVTDSTP